MQHGIAAILALGNLDFGDSPDDQAALLPTAYYLLATSYSYYYLLLITRYSLLYTLLATLPTTRRPCLTPTWSNSPSTSWERPTSSRPGYTYYGYAYYGYAYYGYAYYGLRRG